MTAWATAYRGTTLTTTAHYAEAAQIDLHDALELEALDPADPQIDLYLEAAALNEIKGALVAGDECDLGHLFCEDHLHSKAYHSADCWCGRTEADCTED